ncbi:hypothetical protein B5M09_011972 [Aphanomyces astaci]|uniref:Uncharacterized protein n=1 Tax=Aphanomyces astaci TaxID=112090 RepID=A0A425D5X6_APHAT|nr:hypothetical protein B5M09_011972 [Aphanomyces astaci]
MTKENERIARNLEGRVRTQALNFTRWFVGELDLLNLDPNTERMINRRLEAYRAVSAERKEAMELAKASRND